jgi:hypothetical protein
VGFVVDKAPVGQVVSPVGFVVGKAAVGQVLSPVGFVVDKAAVGQVLNPVGFVVDKAAVGQVLSLYTSVSPGTQHHPPSGADTTRQMAAAVKIRTDIRVILRFRLRNTGNGGEELFLMPLRRVEVP